MEENWISWWGLVEKLAYNILSEPYIWVGMAH